ncbi:hypothetical protein GUJ93_ZPchr0012g22200 [Zizania palustris]|uniref:GATA-type domain-containing protein n=1 Tax=Zizania palustris TaxID=103762 RepID=A0A8J5WRY0_ZIZPA|nr:hypothetical protein GUJ93_ZPchr0012g22200 [Zizania palustris]KAG8093692.1 hypothetical protein GUJ93_ZPchr0012g22200 [Zizania palustris]
MAGFEGVRELEVPFAYVLALSSLAPLAVVASPFDAVVPRKPRSFLPTAVPMAWWSYRVPVIAPLPPPADKPVKKPPKRARRCLNCDAVDTPQWRSGPMGKSTLCNACGVRYRALGTLQDHLPAARTIAEPRPETPESPPDSPIWEPENKSPDIYLVRKPPRKDSAPPPAPAPRRKKKLKKNTMKSCTHCGSSETPQWREGPMGRSTLCNACGVRYRQGRLLPEYRPKGSPTFLPSEHSNNHRQLLELYRKRQENNHSAPPPMVDSATPMPIVDEKPIDLPQEQPIDEPVPAAGEMPSSLDALLDGPSAPLIMDGDDFLD